MSNTPYTYLIGWSKLNKWYYGVRFSKNCHPGDLWETYFTSSKIVKDYRDLYGEPDVVSIRRTFKSVTIARLWEQKALQRLKVTQNDIWLNQSDALSICLDRHTIERTGSILSTKYKGSGNPFYGKKHTDEVKQRIRDKRLARGLTDHQLENLRTVWNGRHRSKENKEKLSNYASSRFFIVNQEGTVRHCFDTSDERLLSGEFIRGRTWKN